MHWRRSGYYGAAGRRLDLGLPFGHGSEEWIKYLQCINTGCRDVILYWFLLSPLRRVGGSLESVVNGDFASRCLRAVGFVRVIARVGCRASGQHTVNRLCQSSVARLAARARQLCDPR